MEEKRLMNSYLDKRLKLSAMERERAKKRTEESEEDERLSGWEMESGSVS